MTLNEAVLQRSVFDDVCSLLRRKDVSKIRFEDRPRGFDMSLTRDSALEEVEKAVVSSWHSVSMPLMVAVYLHHPCGFVEAARPGGYNWVVMRPPPVAVSGCVILGVDADVVPHREYRLVPWESLFGGEV